MWILFRQETLPPYLKPRGGGTLQISAVALDSVIDEAPTFIKMDIEGGELAALKGASDLIRKYKPKLAICIYHKLEDLWEIPLYIKELVPEYNLFIRNHTKGLDEVVCYATL